MRTGVWTRERLIPLRESAREEGDPNRATRSYHVEEDFVLAPQGVGGILDSAWNIFSNRFLSCVGVALAFTLPARAGLIAIRYSGVDRVVRQSIELGIGLMLPFLIGVLVANLVRDHVRGRPTSTWNSVRSTFDRLPSLLAILAVLAVGSSFLYVSACCFPLGFYLYWQLSIAPAVYAVEGRTVGQVFPRGMKLLRGWGSFGRFLGVTLTYFLMFAGLKISLAALEDPNVRGVLLEATSLSGLALDLLATIPAALFSAVSAAYFAIVLTVYYYDVRTRREGLDIEMRLGEIEASLKLDHAESESKRPTSSAGWGA